MAVNGAGAVPVGDTEVNAHEHMAPRPDSKVGHERQVLQTAAAEALRAVQAAHDEWAGRNFQLQQAQERAEAARQELADKLLLFSQYRLSFKEAARSLPCCQPQDDRVKVWEKMTEGLSYS